MTDTERLDKLEKLIWSVDCAEGIALMPWLNDLGTRNIAFQNVDEETIEHLGEELTPPKPTLREAIDAL